MDEQIFQFFNDEIIIFHFIWNQMTDKLGLWIYIDFKFIQIQTTFVNYIICFDQICINDCYIIGPIFTEFSAAKLILSRTCMKLRCQMIDIHAPSWSKRRNYLLKLCPAKLFLDFRAIGFKMKRIKRYFFSSKTQDNKKERLSKFRYILSFANITSIIPRMILIII
jgi:hypothetical protein